MGYIKMSSIVKSHGAGPDSSIYDVTNMNPLEKILLRGLVFQYFS